MTKETLTIQENGFNIADLLTVLAAMETNGTTHIKLTLITDNNAENEGVEIEAVSTVIN